MLKIASLATIPGRERELKKCIDSLYKQVDKIHVAFNYGNKEIPIWIKDYDNVEYSIHDNSIGDAAKFYGVQEESGYIFICDDDILYPHDYVKTMISKIKKYKCVITIAGSNIQGKIESYYKDRKKVATAFTRKQARKDTYVHIPATGGLAYDGREINIPLEIFEKKNMADVFVGKYCNENGIKILCISKRHGWIKEINRQPNRYSIYNTRGNHDAEQADICNKVKWK